VLITVVVPCACVTVSKFVSLDPSSWTVMCGIFVTVTGIVVVATAVGYCLNISPASRKQLAQLLGFAGSV
jgi:hypothetical protein